MTVKTTGKPAIDTIIRRGCTVTMFALILNAAIYLGGSTFTFPPDAITLAGVPLTLAPVLIATLLGGGAAIGGYVLFTRLFSQPQANKLMLILSVGILILMFFTPFTVTNVSAAQIILTQFIHVVAALPALQFSRY